MSDGGVDLKLSSFFSNNTVVLTKCKYYGVGLDKDTVSKSNPLICRYCESLSS